MRRMIPNVITFGNLYCGVLSIAMLIAGDSANAATLIFVALLLDALDGRVARMLKVSNELGKELDSLADIVTFGVAPAILVSQTYLYNWGFSGILIAGLFPLYGCYRLARFNVKDSQVSLSYFRGLPITAAGGIVGLLVVFEGQINVWLFLVIYFVLAQMMVSVVEIPSFKSGVKKTTVLSILFGLYLVIAMTTNYIHDEPIMMYGIVLLIYIVLVMIYHKKTRGTYNLREQLLKKSRKTAK